MSLFHSRRIRVRSRRRADLDTSLAAHKHQMFRVCRCGGATTHLTVLLCEVKLTRTTKLLLSETLTANSLYVGQPNRFCVCVCVSNLDGQSVPRSTGTNTNARRNNSQPHSPCPPPPIFHLPPPIFFSLLSYNFSNIISPSPLTSILIFLSQHRYSSSVSALPLLSYSFISTTPPQPPT